jgi:transposase
MPIALDQLPDDIDVLKSLVADQVARNEQLQSKVVSLQEQLNLALARRYAASSEKLSPDQIRLFDEAEAETQASAPAEDETVTVPAHTRRKRGRKPLPAALPRVELIHELPEAERVCPHDGNPLAEIGEVTSEQLDIIPARIQVIRHIRKQYACSCGHCIKTAALPPQPIPKSLASPGLLAHIAVSKYQDALPLYRQEAILSRIGVDLPHATLANLMIMRAA